MHNRHITLEGVFQLNNLPPRGATDLHEPVQQNCPHLGLQKRMVLHHVDVAAVGLILLQHVVPHHILTGPAGRTSEMGAHTHVKSRRQTIWLLHGFSGGLGDKLERQETTPQQRYSPQSRKWGTPHRGGKYVLTVIVGEAWAYQTNWLVFFLIRCWDPPVRTGIRTPAQLHTERP